MIDYQQIPLVGFFVVMLIQTAIFLTPVVILSYKQGRKDQKFEELLRDVNGIGIKVASTRDDHAQTLSELKAQVDTMNQTLTKVTTSMEFILEEVRSKKHL